MPSMTHQITYRGEDRKGSAPHRDKVRRPGHGSDDARATFKDTLINENLVRDLAGGVFVAQQRNVVLVGGTGTGKTHLAIAIARSCIRAGSRGRFFNTVDLVNRLEGDGRSGPSRAARRLSHPARLHSSRRVRLSSVCAVRWPALVPLDQPSLKNARRSSSQQISPSVNGPVSLAGQK